jgi:glycosyltransferase involved in cell wall biosynthesis
MLTLSLIIPVYNEERHIRACLDAIKNQSIMPDEVLVIDNNCTDNTVAIAKEYDFVTVIREHKQGLIFARNTGFNIARSDILGRIDADSVIDADWVEKTKQFYEQNPNLHAVTGLARTVIIPYVTSLTSKILSQLYFIFIDSNYGSRILWGANMSLRKSAWLKIRNEVHVDDNMVHEDQDMSCVLNAQGLKIARQNGILITTIAQNTIKLSKLRHYDRLRSSTLKLHVNAGSLDNQINKIPSPFKKIFSKFIGFIFRILFYGVGAVSALVDRLKLDKI